MPFKNLIVIGLENADLASIDERNSERAPRSALGELTDKSVSLGVASSPG